MKRSGKKVRDAREPLFFYVDIDDVKSASPKDPLRCAAANAIKRQCGCKQAVVYRTSVLIEYPKEWVRYQAPRDLHKSIMAYDRGGKFENSVYRLQTPRGSRPGQRSSGKWKDHKTSRKAKAGVVRRPAKDVRRAAPRGRSAA